MPQLQSYRQPRPTRSLGSMKICFAHSTMSQRDSIAFPPFVMDLRAQRLWRHKEEIRLPPKECLGQFGEREAYMPVLEALGRLCRQSGGERLGGVFIVAPIAQGGDAACAPAAAHVGPDESLPDFEAVLRADDAKGR